MGNPAEETFYHPNGLNIAEVGVTVKPCPSLFFADLSHLYASFRALNNYHVSNGRRKADVPFVKL